MESFWSRLEVQLFNRRKWKTRIELASAIHDYTELWHNTRRRHSALGMRTPVEIENAWLAGAQNGVVDQAGGARTAPTQVIAENRGAGLSETSEQAVHPNHEHLLLNNNNGA